MKKIFYAILLLNLLICLSFSTLVLANGVLLESIGAITTGRGATNIAFADSGSMVHDNPAGLAKLKNDEIVLNTEFISFSMHYHDPDNDKEGQEPLFTLPSLFYMKHFNGLPLGIGLGIFSSAGYATDYDLIYRDPNYGQRNYFSSSSLSKILLGAGYKITNQWSFGIGIGASYSKVELKLPYTFQTGDLALKIPFPALIDLEADGWSYTWNVGAQWDISSKSTLGLTYRCQDSFDMQGDLDMDIPALASLGLLDTTAHYALDFEFHWPQSAGLGILTQLTGTQKLSFDVLWVDWSSAFDDITLRLSNGDNPVFETQVGSAPQDIIPLEWKDSCSFRLGYEHIFTPKDTIRCGYLYSQSPVPDNTLVPMIPGILTDMISIGYSREWNNLTLNLAYLYAFPSEQSVGKSKIIGGDFDSSSVKESLHCFSLGFSYRM